MEDKARMITAARRMARRIAKKTELTYQQALDKVARDLGRDHWAHYASDPVAVPRDEGPAVPPVSSQEGMSSDDRFEIMKAVLSPPSLHLPQGHRRIVPKMADRPQFLLSGRDWNMPLETRPPYYGSAFLPGWNALSDSFVGDHVSNEDRERHIEDIARILVVGMGAPSYFVDRARLSLVGFLLAELAMARRDGRSASIPSMLDWISEGLARFGEEMRRLYSEAEARGEDADYDGMKEFLKEVVAMLGVDGMSTRAVVEILPLVSMSPKERSGVLGTMDQGLLPFKAREIREVNS